MNPLLALSAILVLASLAAAGDMTPLFSGKGFPQGWVMGTVKDVGKRPPENTQWFINQDGELTGTNTYDTWIMSEKEYDDFELQFEFKVSPLGNSGVALRAPLHGDPAYDGMELQIVDPRYYEGHGAPEQLTGAIYRALPPKKQMFKPEAWNKYEITCHGANIKVVLNGEVVQEFNLDAQTAVPHRDSPQMTAPALKDRPRKGHIGFQELCRDGGHTFIRNVKLKPL